LGVVFSEDRGDRGKQPDKKIARIRKKERLERFIA
jgi:hypothetical protein